MKNKIQAAQSKDNLHKKKIDSPKSGHTILIMNSIFFLGAIILYGWTSTFNFGLDDNYVTDALSEIENNLSGIKKLFSSTFAVTDYRPISVFSFWLERYFLGSIIPGYSHFINVLLFGFLLTRIYKFILISKFYADDTKLKLLAFITVVLFLVHPNHVSVVANIKSRDSLLSMIFGLMSAIQFLKLIDDKKWWRIILVLVFILTGFLAKMDCYTFMVAPLLVAIMYRNISIKKSLLFLFFVFIIYQVTFGVKGSLMSNAVNNDGLRSVLMDASRSPLVNNDSLINRISLSCITMLYYIKFLFIPFGYHFYFGYNQIPLLPLFHPINFLSVFLYVTIGILCLWLYKKNRIYLFSFLFFLIGIAYASNIPEIVAGIVMDRYNFIASLGFCLAFAAFIVDYFNVINYNSILKNKLVISVVLIYCVCTVYRTSAWKDSLTLYKRDIAHLEKSVHANRVISVAYIQKTLFEEKDNAIKDENMKLAELYIDRALKISDKSPDVFEAKGICELYKGNNRQGLLNFQKSKSLDSNYLSAINYIGVSYRNLEMTDSAYYYFNYVMQRETTYSYGADNLLQLLVKNNRMHEADSVISQLTKRYPDNQWLQNTIQSLRR